MAPLLFAVVHIILTKLDDLVMLVLDFKSDWPAFNEAFGLRSWSHKSHPCPCCLVDFANLLSLLGFSLYRSPYPEYTHQMYVDDVDRLFKAGIYTL